MAGGIEETILGNIEAQSGPFDEDDQDSGTPEPGQQPAPDEQDQVAGQLNRRTRQPTDEGDLRQPIKPAGKDQRKGPRTDAKGNVVDGQGNVIASRGLERTAHTQLERAR